MKIYHQDMSHMKTYLHNYWQANHVTSKKWKNKNAKSYGWSPPKNDAYKINFDGFVLVNGNSVAGFVIRNA